MRSDINGIEILILMCHGDNNWKEILMKMFILSSNHSNDHSFIINQKIPVQIYVYIYIYIYIYIYMIHLCRFVQTFIFLTCRLVCIWNNKELYFKIFKINIWSVINQYTIIVFLNNSVWGAPHSKKFAC